MSIQRIRLGALALGLLALVLFPLVSTNLYFQNLLILTFMLAIGATSWNVMGGYAGYLSLGSSAFIGLGAYTTGILNTQSGLSPFVGCLAGGVVAATVAALLSLATSRTRGMYFVIVTFATLELLGLVARNWSSLTGGAAGLALPLPTWDLKYENWPFYYSLLVLLVATVATSALLRRSKLGAGLFAIQDDEGKAAGLGIRTAVYKMVAFVAGSAFLGVAGGIYGYYVDYLDPTAMFDIVTSVLMVLAALLGGRGTLWGPVLGAFLVEPLAEFTNTGLGGADAGAIRLITFGSLLGAVVLFLPRGILPSLRQRRAERARGSRRAASTFAGPSALAIAVDVARPRVAARGQGDLLRTHELARSFGGIPAVSGVDLALRPGEVTGLIGPNGSGKTTLFNLLDGTLSPSAGQVFLEGRRLDTKGRAFRAHSGIARTYQLPRLFPSLTVLENLVLPERSTRPGRWLRPRVLPSERAAASAMLDRLGLFAFADASPTELSYGQRKLVELAQVLALAPVLVLLDEPAAGISPALTQRLVAMVTELNAAGVSFLVVEHDLAFIGEICDRVYVMAAGEVISTGTVDEVSQDARVVDAYLGDFAALTTASEVDQ
ncbi:MAG: branched-chain amino acid transport system ATP-binding protein livM [Frankiales bacterium]|jgi:branched-chain amino acid transport system permease protein|nr:branched-chain amino acid transport system ATP-binding protein livM [Frankiales bacterium]